MSDAVLQLIGPLASGLMVGVFSVITLIVTHRQADAKAKRNDIRKERQSQQALLVDAVVATHKTITVLTHARDKVETAFGMSPATRDENLAEVAAAVDIAQSAVIAVAFQSVSLSARTQAGDLNRALSTVATGCFKDHLVGRNTTTAQVDSELEAVQAALTNLEVAVDNAAYPWDED